MAEILEINPPRARKTDPATSKEAKSKYSLTQTRLDILRFLRVYGPAASYQMAQRLKRSRDSISPHLKPMAELGLIKKTGETIVNPYTNNKCETWRLYYESTVFDVELRTLIENHRLSTEHVCVCRTCGKVM